jgi:hypothetical protein
MPSTATTSTLVKTNKIMRFMGSFKYAWNQRILAPDVRDMPKDFKFTVEINGINGNEVSSSQPCGLVAVTTTANCSTHGQPQDLAHRQRHLVRAFFVLNVRN